MAGDAYMDRCDPWPLNPNGELLLGVKIEDKVALANVEETLKVPGIGVGEGGPGDMALSLGVKSGDQRLLDAEARIFAAAKLHKLAITAPQYLRRVGRLLGRTCANRRHGVYRGQIADENYRIES